MQPSKPEGIKAQNTNYSLMSNVKTKDFSSPFPRVQCDVLKCLIRSAKSQNPKDLHYTMIRGQVYKSSKALDLSI